MDLAELQQRSAKWRNYNFPDHTPEDQLIGAMEELGELAHANLKRRQGIRGYVKGDPLLVAEADAIGDIIIYLSGYCSAVGIDMAEAVRNAWAEVEARDWQKNKEDGT